MEEPMSRALACLTIIAVLFLTLPSLVAQDKGLGPTELFITYSCDPSNRVEFRKYMEGPGVAQFEKWKKEGVVADYLILFNCFVDFDTWDMMVVLSFDRYVQTASWKQVEKSYPGGLAKDALKLAVPRNTYSADLTWQNASKTIKSDRSKAVYFVIPYEYAGETGEETYKNYNQTYVIPQLNGWIDEGILTSYSIYLNNHQTGKPWEVMMIFEYKDIESFALRDVVKNKVRDTLKKNPAWKIVSDIKHQFRTERETVISEAILPSK
jgi:hypothetical protein